MKYTARRMASRLAKQPQMAGSPRRVAGPARAARCGRSRLPSAQAGQGLRQDRQPRGAADAPAARHQARATVALQSLLRGDVGHPDVARRAAPPRRGSLRRRLRSPARRRRGSGPGQRFMGRAAPHTRSSGPTAFCARKSPSARSASTRRANTTSRRSSPPSRTIASWSLGARACSSRTATSGQSSFCGTGCGRMCASTRST